MANICWNMMEIWCLPLKFAEVKWKKHVWKFIKAQTRIQNDLEQPNPNFPVSGLRLLEAVHVGWLELPSCQFYQLMKRISRFSDVSFMYLFRFRFWRCWMYFNVSECHHFFLWTVASFFWGNTGEFFAFVPGVPEENVEQAEWIRYPMSPRYPLPFCPFHIVSSRFLLKQVTIKMFDPFVMNPGLLWPAFAAYLFQ